MRIPSQILLALVLTTFAVAAAGCDNKARQSRGSKAKEMVAAGAVLLDVRSPGEFQRGHLPNALNIPISELGRRISEIPASSKVVIYCESGVRSRQGVSLLKKKGHEVFDLGSWRDWGP